MAEPATFRTPRSGLKDILPYAVGGLAILAFAWFVWTQLGTVNVRQREEDRPITQVALPDIPPPPPPPPEPQDTPPEPTEEVVPDQATPEPKAAEDAPAPMTIAGEAQAGSDAFGLQAGSGGGFGAPGGTGTCLRPPCGPPAAQAARFRNDGSYWLYLKGALQSAVSRDRRLANEAFEADYQIEVTPGGQIRLARLVKSSGSRTRDEQLKQVLESVRGLQAPPATAARYPVVITVRGRERG